MRVGRAPVFLARKGYRQRRLSDAARMLPVAGGVLILVPVLWQPAVTPVADTARGWVYMFGVWGALILSAYLLSRRLPLDARQPGTGVDGSAGGTDADDENAEGGA
jgi:hypothetical protein